MLPYGFQYGEQKECSANDCGEMHLSLDYNSYASLDLCFFLNHFVPLTHTNPNSTIIKFVALHRV